MPETAPPVESIVSIGSAEPLVRRSESRLEQAVTVTSAVSADVIFDKRIIRLRNRFCWKVFIVVLVVVGGLTPIGQEADSSENRTKVGAEPRSKFITDAPRP